MLRPLISIIALAGIPTVALVVESASAARAAGTRTLWVAHYRTDCVARRPQPCYLIKEGHFEEWTPWVGEIAGFDYEEGFAYEIRVIEESSDDISAAPSPARLRLVEILSKIEAFEPPADSTAARGRQVQRTDEAAAVPPPPEPRSAIDPAFHGYLTVGDGLEARAVRLCGERRSVWVEDETGELLGVYRELAGYSNRAVYFRVRARLGKSPTSGFGAHYERQLTVTEIIHVALETAGCDDDLSGIDFIVSGTEPFWRIEISPRAIAWSEPGSNGRLLFPVQPPKAVGDGLVYRGQIDGHPPRLIEVILVKTPCTDDMAGARYSYRATVRLDERELTGCALPGLRLPLEDRDRATGGA